MIEKSTAQNIQLEYGRYILMWLALVALSALSIALSSFVRGDIQIIAVIAAAVIQAAILLVVFMGLRLKDAIVRFFIGFILLYLIFNTVLFFLTPAAA